MKLFPKPHSTVRSRIAPALLLVFFCVSCGTPSHQRVSLNGELSSDKLKQEESELLAETLAVQAAMAEKQIFYEDPALEAYLAQLAAPVLAQLNLPPEMGFTFKIVRDPTVNAFAFMNGHIYFHSGMLARMREEESLAFVLAHEISHVFHRDQVYHAHNFKKKTVAFKIADLLITPAAMIVWAGGLASTGLSIAYAASVTGYGRPDESKADLFGLEKILKARYDPRKAAGFFDLMLREKEDYKQGIEIFFLSSHPANEERKEEVLSWITAHEEEILSAEADFRKAGDFFEKTYEIRRDNLKLNADLGRYYHALDEGEVLLEKKPDDPVIHHYMGEAYRMMPDEIWRVKEEVSEERWKKISHKKEDEDLKKEWLEKAREYFEKAAALDPAYAPPHKGLGIYFKERGEYEKAAASFQKYLELDPEARDARSIHRHLKDIGEMSGKAAA